MTIWWCKQHDTSSLPVDYKPDMCAKARWLTSHGQKMSRCRMVQMDLVPHAT